MAYCTLTDVKTYLGISVNSDDALITALIPRAQKAIDSRTRRIFEAASATRYYVVGADTVGKDLYLDEDLAEITTVKSNADAVTPDTITTADYVTLPRNKTPYYGIRILGNSTYYWRYTSNPEKGIEITGKWGYSTTAPYDIVHACIRLAAYLYRQKDAQVFDVTADLATGEMIIPKGIPADVEKLLMPYIKPTL